MKALPLTPPLMAAAVAMSLASAASRDVHAAVIYDNGISAINFGAPSEHPDGLAFADNFRLDTDSAITDIHFTGLYFNESPPAEDTFIVRFFEDDGGVPGQRIGYLEAPVTERTLVGELMEGFTTSQDLYSYDLTVDDNFSEFVPFQMEADYWLSVTNDVPAQWFWTGRTGDNLAIEQFGFGQEWMPIEELYIDFDFQLSGSPVPVSEPSSLALLLTGAALIGITGRRKRTAGHGRTDSARSESDPIQSGSCLPPAHS